MHDLKFALRQLLKNPGFTAVAVLALALGIGANTAIFSVLDVVLLRMLPVRHPEELIALNHAGGDRRGNGFPYPVFERLRERNPAFSDLFAFSTWPEATLTIAGRDEPLPGGVLLVSGDYHAGLGIRPMLGRLISAKDNRAPGEHPVAVLSYGFWQRKFGGAASVIGQSIALNGTAYTIVGVTPPLLRGREFTLQDDERAAKVAIINETAARRLFGGENPIGRRIGVGTAGDTILIGVVKDAKLNSLREATPQIMYRPFLQSGPPRRMTFAIRTAVPPLSMLTALRRELDAVQRDLPLFGFTTLRSVVEKSMAQERLFAVLSSLFGGVALALAAIGLYGVMAYSVNQRTREIGLRIALGAQTRNVLGLMLGQGLKVVFVGLVAGLIAAVALTRLIASRLYGITATDPVVLAVVPGLLVAVAVFACWLPARRAARVDPMEALRCE